MKNKKEKKQRHVNVSTGAVGVLDHHGGGACRVVLDEVNSRRRVRLADVSRHSLATYDDSGLGGSTLAELDVREKALLQAASKAGVTTRHRSAVADDRLLLGGAQDPLRDRHCRRRPGLPRAAVARRTCRRWAVQAAGKMLCVGGTSASSPSFAGLVTLLNEVCMAAGGMALGFARTTQLLPGSLRRHRRRSGAPTSLRSSAKPCHRHRLPASGLRWVTKRYSNGWEKQGWDVTPVCSRNTKLTWQRCCC